MLQDPELIIHRLRLRYLSQVQDGIGERIINFSHTKTNTTAFRIAGGDASLMDRCISPDIPLHDSVDVGTGPNMRNGLSPVSNGLSEDADSGGTLRRTVTDLSLASKRSRNNLHEDLLLAKLNPALRDDEASDQSDISDTEEVSEAPTYGSQQKHMFMIGLHKKIADEPKFEKMPVRRRGTSDASVTYRASMLPQARRPSFFTAQNGSESDLSRTGDRAPYSIISNGFMPVDVGAPFEEPGIGVGIGLAAPDTPDALDEFPDVLASFEVAEDSSEDEYDLQGLVTSPLPLSNSLMHSLPKPILPAVDLGTPSSLGNIQKSKPRPESVFQPSSGLTALIKASEAAEVNPLERKYGVMNGKADLKPLRLKIYRPTSSNPSQPFEVVIKTSATVVDTIGYALLRYIEDKREPLLTVEQKDPNYWTLRIVEDDGELDEDFPALERLRPILKFSFDEFALVEATTGQLSENQLQNPDPLGMKSSEKAVPDLHVQPPSNPTSASGKAMNVSSTLDNSATGMLPSLPTSAMVATPGSSVRTPARAPGPSVLLKVRLRPEPGAPNMLQSQVTALDVTTETYLGDVLDQVCKRRNLDKYMFCLRLPGSNIVVPSDRTVESLQGRTEVLLVRKKAIDLLTDTAVARSLTPNAPIMSSTYSGSVKPSLGESNTLGQYLPDLVTSNTYQHWIVWRRQPMSFMGRHERILAIDGEYVHVSPTEVKTMFESPKTSSIHVGQIVACKQSRKMPVNFKVVIIKAGQTKRYDFEASRPQESETIVAKIKTLTRNWAANRSARQSRLVTR